MTVDRDEAYLVGLVTELRQLQEETGWAEFKQNNFTYRISDHPRCDR
jgi:hypothetical protein